MLKSQRKDMKTLGFGSKESIGACMLYSCRELLEPH